MNNYIINPSVFYWINVLSIIQTVCAVFGAVSLLGAVGCGIGWFYNISEASIDNEPEEEWTSYERTHMKYARKCKKICIISAIVGIIIVVVSIFIPGKTTSIEMLVAKTATFDNVDWTVQQVKEVIDYITASLKGII